MIKVQFSPLHAGLLRPAETRELQPPETTTAQSQAALESPPPRAPHVQPVLSRVRRELQNPVAESAPFKASVRQFAEALVDQADRQLAVAVGNGLVRQRLDAENAIHGRSETIDLPPDSTFGKLWGELADALDSEPFKSFAYAKNIDPLKLVINLSGRLSALSGDQSVNFDLAQDADWAAASSAVLAAAKKVSGSNAAVVFFGADRASPDTIARFYGLPLRHITNQDALPMIGTLLNEGAFSALSSSDPLHAPLKQRNREAKQRIVDLPAQALNQRLAQFAPSSATEKVAEADQALAQLVGRGLMKLAPETDQYQTSVTLSDIPQYATFSVVRKNLLTALTGSAFTTFAHDNDLDPTSVRINPVSGVLTGKVNGVDTRFTVNDVSGWTDAWAEIHSAVQQMAAGNDDEITYPTTASARLYEVMAFYNEPPPHQEDTRQRGWEQRQLKATLGRIDEMAQNKGFKAFIDAAQNDPAAMAVRQRQQAVAQQLTDTPLAPSPLETLAASVEANLPAPADTDETRADALASAEHELATTVHRAMLELKNHPTKAASMTLQPIPANSLFGQWRDYLNKALKGHGFVEWANLLNIDLTALRYEPISKALIATVNGVDQRFTASDVAQTHPEYFDVLTPIFNAAQAFAGDRQSITLAHATDSSVPYPWVANFYGLSADVESAAFEQQTALIGRTQQLPKHADNPQKIVTWLNRQNTALGDSNDRYALIHALKNWTADDSARRFVVDPASSHQPKGVTTVAKFLLDKHAYPVASKADNDNLLAALQMPIPQSPALGNRWGFLATQPPLNTAQRSALAAAVKQSIGTQDTLLGYLGSGVTPFSTDPEQALDQMLSSDTALELATRLQTEMKGAATVTSLKQWLLTALVLELDPTTGSQRDEVAGYDFRQSGNWGLDTSTLRERFNQHLATDRKIPHTLAPVAAHLLMAGAAPYLLIKDAPSMSAYTSIEWASFTTAVNRIERAFPGATANMTFKQVMDFHTIKPISAAETKQLALAQMNPVMDWAIANHHVARSDKHEYTWEQYQSSLEKLDKQIKETSAGKNFLREVKPPARRERSLAALREAFPGHIDFTGRYLQVTYLGGLTGSRIISIVEAYEAGLLGQHLNYTGPAGITAAELNNAATTLPAVTAQFDQDIEADYALRRQHTVNLLKNMLSQLPLADRDAINNGTVEIYQVKGAGNGIVLIANNSGANRAFAIYPGVEKIVKIPDIDRAIPYGHSGAQTIDAAAFNNGAEPQSGIRSDVTLTHLGQGSLVDDYRRPGWRSLIAHNETPDLSTYGGERTQHLAEVLVDTVYLNKPSFIFNQRGANSAEQLTKPSDVFEGILRVVPGGSSALDIYHGDYAKAVLDLGLDIIIYATTDGLGKLWTFAKAGAGWAAAKASAKFSETFGTEALENVVLRDFTAASNTQSSNALSRLQENHLAEPTADMANGSMVGDGAHEQINLTAVLKDGNWYAYDIKTQAAYGPALQGFSSDTSSPLRQQTFSDGTHALVAETPLAQDAYTIARANGFDVVNEGKVLRYDSRKPGVLTDLASADHYRPLDGFEALCPAPVGFTRAKRGANDTCFSRVVSNVSGELAQELQALEHVRLFPSEPKLFKKDQFVIFERRRFKMVDGEMGPQLEPVLDNKPIVYKNQIKGSLKHDPQFGLYAGQTADALELETRVVKLNSISTLCNDKREVRGVIIGGARAGSADKYLVIEADTAEFYYAKLNDSATGELTFAKCTTRELPLVQSYRQKLSIRQGASKTPFDADFIALPTLSSAFQALERSGYSKSEVDELKTFCKTLTDEQQREVLYQLQRTKAITKADIALKPIRVSALDKPEGFATWTAERQNKFYAEHANVSVNRDMHATGLGPSNQVRSAADQSRAAAANMVIGWLRRTVPFESENYSTQVLKAGAGNCGEMARISKDIITKSGGRAYEWNATGAHVFTIVGGPAQLPAGTVDFAGPAWADAWIVDPWADIACPAREYTQKVQAVMTRWERENLKILEGGEPISPLDKNWLDTLIVKPKTPYAHLYARA